MTKRIDDSAHAKVELTTPDTPLTTRSSFDPPAEPDWHHMIAVAAYFHAQKRGFECGHALEDWLRAEQEVKALISP